MEGWGLEAWKCLCSVRESSPLIQCITNYVSMDIMANTLLAAGASPAMVHALEEIPDFTPQVKGLCINIGTLSPGWIASMRAAAAKAVEAQKPWVLDPVAVGASAFRTDTCMELINLKPTVIRGNASEIMAVAGASVGPTKILQTLASEVSNVDMFLFCYYHQEENISTLFFCFPKNVLSVQFSGKREPACTQFFRASQPANFVLFQFMKWTSDHAGQMMKGVDSSHASTDALEAAKDLACTTKAIVAVSGAVDFVTDGERVLGVSNGVPLMQRITATGCAVTALIAAFVAVHPGHALEGTAFALALFGLAGEIGMEKANGPASLRMHLIDALHGLDKMSVTSRTKISQI